MANQVTFQIKIETLGADSVKNVTMDAEELGRVVREVTNEQEKLNTKLLDINQAQQAIQNICSGFEQLSATVREFTSVYALQETAERKLAQVMRNTMSASDAEVRSIRELCSAQQELGVIGDEVQLAGAQELATYLEKKSSLEQLIPVMNDMLAQQYGLEASQESAATIATMLGKVMEGQTQALSRYGYSFTEAQEQVLKFGTEEERAAVLAEVVEQSVGGMNAALAQTDSGKAQQLSNAMGDLKEQAGECLARIEPVLRVLSGIGMSFQGIMGVVTGMKGLATEARVLAASLRAATAASVGLRVALRGLMIASVVGAVLAAATLVIQKLMEAMDGATDSANELVRAQQSLEDVQQTGERAAEEARIAIEREKDALADLIENNGDATSTIATLNEKYGETFGYHQTAAEWYDVLTAKSELYCEQLMLQAQAQAIASKMADNAVALSANFRTQEQLRANGNDKESFNWWNPGQVMAAALQGGTDKIWHDDSDAMKDAKNEAKELLAEKRALREENERLVSSLKDLGVKMQQSSSPRRPTGSTVPKKQTVQDDTTERIDLKSVAGMKVGGISSTIDFTPKIDEKEVMQQLGSLSWKVEMELDQEALKELEAKAEAQRKKFDYATSSVANFGGALAQLGQTIKSPALNIAGTMMQAIATMVQSFAQALLMTSTMGPWAWLAFGATGLAQVTAMVSAVKALPKYADGAMAFGPTLGWFGEYSNAATNPEVVAPLDKLRGMLGTGYGGNRLEFRLKAKGRDLVGVVDREVNLRNRT